MRIHKDTSDKDYEDKIKQDYEKGKDIVRINNRFLHEDFLDDKEF